jgi:L,D-transpeptidase ErfK/SrfK
MRTRNRSRSVSPYAAAGAAAIVCTAGFVAWQMGWLPIELQSPDTGVVVDADDEAFADVSHRFGTRHEFDRRGADRSSVDPTIFEAQFEPDVTEGVTDISFDPSSDDALAESSRDWDDATARSMPDRFPSAVEAAGYQDEPASLGDDEREVQGRGYADSPRGAIRQVSNEVDQPAAAETRRHAEPTRNADASAGRATQAITDRVDLAAIDRLIENGDDITAHRELSKIYWGRPEMRDAIQRRIDTTALSIYFSPQPHYMPAYEVQPGDQLRLIARKYDVPWEHLAKLNRTDPRRIRPGQKLKVIKGPFSAYVDLSDYELTIHAHGYYVRRYRVGVGKNGTSPIGKFTVLKKVADPTYYGPDGEVIPHDDPTNPLGNRWIDIGDSFGIHGTIDPDSIGKSESKGCIRMLNSEVEEVFDLLDVGSEVIIRR